MTISLADLQVQALVEPGHEDLNELRICPYCTEGMVDVSMIPFSGAGASEAVVRGASCASPVQAPEALEK